MQAVLSPSQHGSSALLGIIGTSSNMLRHYPGTLSPVGIQRSQHNGVSLRPGAVLGMFIWVGQSKAKQINGSGVHGDHGDDLRRLGRPGTSLGKPRPTRPNS